MWSSVLDSVTKAAQQAGKVAAEAAHKAAEIAEGAAEEAGRKLKGLGIEAQPAAPAPPPPEDLAAYGITPDFIDFVRTLNYSSFREFQQDQLPPLNSSDSSRAAAAAATTASGDGEAAGEEHCLNPWQVRHAMLVVRAVKEVDELRFVLCPRYLTDELFWHIYFTLVRKHLPDRAFTWGPDDVLPPMSSLDEHANAGFMLADLGKQFKQFGSRLRAPSGLPALELSTFGISRGGNSAAAVGGDAIGGGSTSAGTASGLEEAMASMLPCKPDGLLENDPDLEAYLQVAINDAQDEGDGGGEEGSGEDIDLDTLMAALEEDGVEEVGDSSSNEEAAGKDGSASNDVGRKD